MAFTVRDFHDLIRILQQYPEWQAELRRVLLTDELLALPALVQELVQAQRRSEERLDRLEQTVAELVETTRQLVETAQRHEERLDRLEQTVARLVEVQEEHNRRLDRLEQTVAELVETTRQLVETAQRHEERLDRLELAVNDLRGRVGELQGDALELHYRERAPGYFGRLLRNIRVLSSQRLAEMFEEPLSRGEVTWDEREKVLLGDIVLRGRRREDDAVCYLVVEVSVGIGKTDVDRAVERARILQRIVPDPVLAVVAGKWISDEMDRYARERGVWRVLDGVIRAPEEP